MRTSGAGSNLTFVGSTFVGNTAAFHAGGIMSIFAYTTVLDSVISDNTCVWSPTAREAHARGRGSSTRKCSALRPPGVCNVQIAPHTQPRTQEVKTWKPSAIVHSKFYPTMHHRRRTHEPT